eukprot:scaffold5771_cov171-Amphora_coffeaeformis.AAC.22
MKLKTLVMELCELRKQSLELVAPTKNKNGALKCKSKCDGCRSRHVVLVLAAHTSGSCRWEVKSSRNLSRK